MRNAIFFSLAALALQGGLIRAQSSLDDRVRAKYSEDNVSRWQAVDGDQPTFKPDGGGCGLDDCAPGPFTIWGKVDYLLWWVKDAPLPIPLVTTGSPGDALPGAIGQPGTRVLYGNNPVDFGPTSGVMLTVGAYLDCDHRFSLEGIGFVIPTTTKTYSATSGDDGNPLLAFPFFNRTPGSVGKSAFQISNPTPVGTPLTGNVVITSTLELFGGEVNFGYTVWRSRNFALTALVGTRYVGLRESLSISNATTDYATTPTSFYSQNDTFSTQNHFYGEQVGVRFQWQCERFFFDGTAKCAAGATNQIVDVNGFFNESTPLQLQLQHGFFSEPSNLGQKSSYQFSVVPSAQLQFGYQITRHLAAVAGYDIMYWTDVVRPGPQIDRNINQTQSAAFNPGGVLAGPASPAPLFVRSGDFWAQGLNLGVTWRY